ncbi:MAG TPA: universal stress protein [Candidatus Polarisedimenticolia bacterium]|nr:universal stress protein [Candidatus Polarisedimenticolia bacterium]
MRLLDIPGHLALKNILYATDLSATAQKAMGYALGIAQRYSSTVYAVHVIQPDVYPFAPPAAWPQMDADEEIFRKEAEAALQRELQSVPHELIFRAGEFWQTLSEIIQEKKIDLIVSGTHGRTGLEKALLGSVAEEIFRRASCPVLTVGASVSSKPREHGQLNRILYATDFSPESLAAAPYAISLAREHRAQLILLHCIENRDDAPTMLQTLHDLVPFGAELRCQPTCVAERGAHGSKILEVSGGHGADIIVLGFTSGSRSANKKSYFYRSALYKIVTQANCPVLTVRG